MVANAIIEKVAIMLLQCADIEDQAGRYNKSQIFNIKVYFNSLLDRKTHLFLQKYSNNFICCWNAAGCVYGIWSDK